MRDILNDYKIFNIDPTKLRSKEFYKNMLEYRTKSFEQFSDTIKQASDFICPLCSQTEKNEYLSLDDYILYECAHCSLVSANVDFSKLGNTEVYDDEAYIKDTTREILDTYDYRKKTFAPERLEYILEKTDLSKDVVSLLDVGCGPGYFLSYLKDMDIKNRGLELASFLVNICKEKGLDVDESNLEDEPNGAYNIITMFDVLEHLTDPKDLFGHLNDKLSPGGYLLAYTPNIHSFGTHLMKENQNLLYPFQHLCFFDEKSLEFLGKETGFTVHSIDYYGLDVMDYFAYKTYTYEFNYLERLKGDIGLFQAILDKQKISNHMRVIFKKA